MHIGPCEHRWVNPCVRSEGTRRRARVCPSFLLAVVLACAGVSSVLTKGNGAARLRVSIRIDAIRCTRSIVWGFWGWVVVG